MPGSPRPAQLELRFTRAHQALPFWAAGIALGCLAAGWFLLGTDWLAEWPDPVVTSRWPAACAALLAGVAAGAAARLTRQAYLLFTPIGIEVSPLFRPASRTSYATWSEVASLGVTSDRRLLEIGLASGGKILVALAPVPPRQRELLARTVDGLVEKRNRNGNDGDTPEGDAVAVTAPTDNA